MPGCSPHGGRPAGTAARDRFAGAADGVRGAPGLPVAVLALFGAGLCSAYLVGLGQWLLDAVPGQLAGRAMAVNSGGLMLGQAVGTAAAGAAAEYLAPHLVVVLAALLGLGATAATAHRVRRRTPRPVEASLADTPYG